MDRAARRPLPRLGTGRRLWRQPGARGRCAGGRAWAWTTPSAVQLRRLGEAINYNAYGDDASDQHIAPQQLYARLAQHAHPLDLLRHDSIGTELDALRRGDLQQALAQPCMRRAVARAGCAARCALGAACHRQLCQHAGGRRARAGACGAAGRPARRPCRQPARAAGHTGGADEFCRRFGGGGRAGAAGIDHLPDSELPRFVAELSSAHWGG